MHICKMTSLDNDYVQFTTAMTAEGVLLVFGHPPIHEVVKLSKGRTGWVLDHAIADLVDATMAMGKPKAIDACYKRMLTGTEGDAKRLRIRANFPRLEGFAADWLLKGDKGQAALQLFFVTQGLNAEGWIDITKNNAPVDGWSFRRCVILKRGSPAVAAGLAKMRSVSPKWAAVMDVWDEAEATLESELGASLDLFKGALVTRTHTIIERAVEPSVSSVVTS